MIRYLEYSSKVLHTHARMHACMHAQRVTNGLTAMWIVLHNGVDVAHVILPSHVLYHLGGTNVLWVLLDRSAAVFAVHRVGMTVWYPFMSDMCLTCDAICLHVHV
jgi:hypothetical protein